MHIVQPRRRVRLSQVELQRSAEQRDRGEDEQTDLHDDLAGGKGMRRHEDLLQPTNQSGSRKPSDRIFASMMICPVCIEKCSTA